ncbi:MAG: glycoside hydrolase family 127 protein [Kiritimatiellae bacterium]|nr:glycoside hydrolase family 127 protein [Kiritimatiellia bacterium]
MRRAWKAGWVVPLMGAAAAMTQPESAPVPPLEPAPLGSVRWRGHLGRRLDGVATARITDPAAWARIYPETEEAFRRREDDLTYPKAGQWRGEFWGKYILSAVAAQRYYADAALRERIARAVEGLLAAQDPNGYLGTYRRSAFAGPTTWNIWCRKYTLWGLLEARELLRDERILPATRRFIDHLASEFGPAASNLIETGHFYGLPSTSILTPVVLLYRASGDPRDLAYAKYITEQWSRHPAGPPDLLRRGTGSTPIHRWFPNIPPTQWTKSYEFMSCVEGMLALHGVTGEAALFDAARNLYHLIRDWERSPLGSVSLNDKFVGARGLVNTLAELCDVVYWNRLAFELFRWTGEVTYLDEFERSLYNALLAGLSPDGTWGLRRLRSSHEHVPAHPHFLPHHHCCVDNLPRGLFQAVEASLWTDAEGVRLALFEPMSARIVLRDGTAVRLELEGDVLADEPLRLVVEPARPAEFDLRVRRPLWARQVRARVAGRPVEAGTARWISLGRNWPSRTVVELSLATPVHAELFEPARYAWTDVELQKAAEEWASLGVPRWDPTRRKTVQVKTVTPADALPHTRAVFWFKGPVALARDARLGEVAPMRRWPWSVGEPPTPRAEPLPAPANVWKAWRLVWPDGTRAEVCDFSSAGNTWDARSRFSAVWLCADRTGGGSDSAAAQ